MADTTVNVHNGHEQAVAYLRRKAWGAGLVVLCAVAALCWRLWQLQVRQGNYYFGQAQQEALRQITIPASRGEILASNGTILAEDLPSFTATLSYTPTPLTPSQVAVLAHILGVPAAQITTAEHGLQAANNGQPYAPVILRSGLSSVQYTALAQNLPNLPGVNVEAQGVRVYPGIPGNSDPGPQLAANVLGYVRAGTIPGEVQGEAGIEQTFNTLNPKLHTNAVGLAGRDGQELVEVDTAGHPVKQFSLKQPVPGNNVVLTLHAGLQAVAQRALQAQLAALRTRTFSGEGGPYRNAAWGAAVAIDVHTGAILALASVPTFNPNAFAQEAISLPGSPAAQSFTKQYQAWAADTAGAPFLDHAIQDVYPPGSTFKPITAIAALQAGVVTPYTHLPCPAFLPVGNAVLHNWIPYFDGNMDLSEAIGQSCDTWFYQVGARVGISAIDRVAAEFGLGQPTGMWELPGEATGVVSSPTLYKQIYGLPWTTALTMQTAIGQGLNEFTVLQMADFIAALANGGTLYQPYLVSEVTNARTGRVIWKQQPVVRRRIPLSPSVYQAVVQAMTSVTQWNTSWAADGVGTPFGTGYWAFYNFQQETQQYLGHTIVVAGKTGTAQTSPSVTPNGWWVSFAPANNPQIAIVVETDQSNEGFVGGAPVAREMFDYYFGLDKAMYDAGAANQIIPSVIEQFFGLGPTQQVPDWWGPPPAPKAGGRKGAATVPPATKGSATAASHTAPSSTGTAASGAGAARTSATSAPAAHASGTKAGG
jgi:penicillin-binding protein 2